MATHVEKRGNQYFVVDNMTGKVVSGGYMLRDMAHAEIRKREKERETKEKPKRFLTDI